MHNPQRLDVLQRAKALNVRLHRAPLRGIGRRAPGLKSQLLRSISSIPTNVVEGFGQPSPKATVRFVNIAIASANELELHLELARELDVLGPDAREYQEELVEIRKMLFGFRAHLERRARRPPKPTDL